MSNEIMDNINGMRENFRQIKLKMKILEEETERLNSQNIELTKELEFYKQLFISHPNSAVFNLREKTKNKDKVWVDPTRDTTEYIKTLDMDDEVKGWLEPIKCER